MGGSQWGSSQKIRSVPSSRTGDKRERVHVVDDFSSYDGRIQQQFMEDVSGSGFDQSSQADPSQSHKDQVIDDFDSSAGGMLGQSAAP